MSQICFDYARFPDPAQNELKLSEFYYKTERATCLGKKDLNLIFSSSNAADIYAILFYPSTSLQTLTIVWPIESSLSASNAPLRIALWVVLYSLIS